MWNLRGLMGIYSGYHEIYPPAIKHGLLENPPFTSRIFPSYNLDVVRENPSLLCVIVGGYYVTLRCHKLQHGWKIPDQSGRTIHRTKCGIVYICINRS